VAAEVFVAGLLNVIMLICYNACSLMYLELERLFCFKCQTQLFLQHGDVLLLTTDTEFNDVIAPYL